MAVLAFEEDHVEPVALKLEPNLLQVVMVMMLVSSIVVTMLVLVMMVRVAMVLMLLEDNADYA